jgi:hypothetical protein
VVTAAARCSLALGLRFMVAELQQLKRRLDPANLFRFNANIPPADA